VVDLTLSGADVLLFTLSFLPRKAFEVPNGVPFFWELGVEMATAAMAEEAQAEAMTQALSSRDKSD
jgi:hypothetical protein